MSEQNTAFEKWLDDTVLVGNPDTVAEWAWNAATAEANKRINALESDNKIYAECNAELKEANDKLSDALILRNNKLTELMHSNNTLREALTLLSGCDCKIGDISIFEKVNNALATPAESLQAHDDALITKCADIASLAFDSNDVVDAILALKEGK